MSFDKIIEFTPEQVSRIRKQYEFSESFDLGRVLDRIAMHFEKPEYFNHATPVSMQKKRFMKIKKLAEKLEAALNDLSKDELMLIGRHHGNWSKTGVIDFIKEQRYIAEGAFADLLAVSGKKGAPKRDTERNLIEILVRIYKDGTGQSDWYSQSEVTSEYTSNLISFIEEITNYLNAPINNRFIGDTIKSYRSKTKQ